MDSLMHTLRIALRSLSRAPSLTALVVLTLGLGIGATTSVYSVARAALFDDPPFPNTNRLMLVWERDRDGAENNVGWATYRDLSSDKMFESSAAGPQHPQAARPAAASTPDSRTSASVLSGHLGHCSHEQDAGHERSGQAGGQERDSLCVHHDLSSGPV